MGKNATGQDGYTMIGNNCLMYEPKFDRQRPNIANVQQQAQGESIQLKSIFNSQNLAHLQQRFPVAAASTRNSTFGSGSGVVSVKTALAAKRQMMTTG